MYNRVSIKTVCVWMKQLDETTKIVLLSFICFQRHENVHKTCQHSHIFENIPLLRLLFIIGNELYRIRQVSTSSTIHRVHVRIPQGEVVIEEMILSSIKIVSRRLPLGHHVESAVAEVEFVNWISPLHESSQDTFPAQTFRRLQLHVPRSGPLPSLWAIVRSQCTGVVNVQVLEPM